METILEYFGGFGLPGVVIAALLYNTWFLQKKIVSIVENNTHAMVDLKATIEKCQIMHGKND